MLDSLLRCARHWLNPPSARDRLHQCVPEWSQPMAQHHAAIWHKVKPYTMTSRERVAALCQSIAYLENQNISGAIVECGVWKGGSMMAAALALQALDSTQRQLYLYDTFAGMTEPADVDIDLLGRPARELLQAPNSYGDMVRARCSLAAVKDALMQTRYPWEKLIFVAGEIELTIPQHMPDQIALLRLDTDWYASTRHELEHLYPRLADGGILIVDDYGHWQGAKKAVDEYFRGRGLTAELRPIDYTGRLLIKRAEPALTLAA